MLRYVIARGLLGALVLAACTSTDDYGRPVWTSTSASIRLDIHAWPNGSAAWEKKRSELTADQLSILASLESAPPVHSKLYDAQEVLVRVTDADTTTREYRVVLGDQFGRGVLSEDLPIIHYASFRPLFEPLRCLVSGATAKEAERAGKDPVTGNPNPLWTEAPDVFDDSGCFNAISAQPDGDPTWVRVNFSSAGTYELALEPCVSGTARLRLHSNDGATELIASPIVSLPACAALTYTVAAPGPLLLSVEGGAFALRVRRP